MKISIVLVLLFLSASAFGKTLRIGSSQEPDTLHPFLSKMIVGDYIYRSVGRTLNVLTVDGKWEPQLAKYTPSIENGKARFVGKGKNKKIVADWEIKEKAKWGDGKPVTGHDVVFSLEVATHPNVPHSQMDDYRNIEKIVVDKKNPKKFSIHYKNASWSYNRMGLFYVLPKHIEGPVFEKHKGTMEGYAKNTNFIKNPTNPGLFSGPYRITDVKLREFVKVERNPHFYGPKAKIDTIIFKTITNTASLEANLRSKTIDMIGFVGITFDQAIAFQKKVKAEKLPYNVNFKPSLTYEHLDLNIAKVDAFKDVRVRQALAFAINRNSLVKALFSNKQPVAYHPFSPISPWYTGNEKLIHTLKHSRKKANQLLDEAGWKMGKDGYRYKGGKKLSFELATTAGNKTRETVQVFLQDQLKKVGVEVKIQNQQARVFFGDSLPKLKVEGMGMFAFTFMPEQSIADFYHSNGIPTKKNGFAGNNWSSWSDKKADTVINKIEKEFDMKRRIKLAHEFIGIYSREVPEIPLYYRAEISVTPKGMKKYTLSGHRFSGTSAVEYWDL